MAQKPKLEPAWIGKENRPKLEPRILLEEAERVNQAPRRATERCKGNGYPNQTTRRFRS